MSVFGCASDNQLNYELNLSSSSLKIKRSDLKKLIFIQAEKMDKFIREKGLYDEFYEKYVMPDLKINLDIGVLNADKSK